MAFDWNEIPPSVLEGPPVAKTGVPSTNTWYFEVRRSLQIQHQPGFLVATKAKARECYQGAKCCVGVEQNGGRSSYKMTRWAEEGEGGSGEEEEGSSQWDEQPTVPVPVLCCVLEHFTQGKGHSKFTLYTSPHLHLL